MDQHAYLWGLTPLAENVPIARVMTADTSWWTFLDEYPPQTAISTIKCMSRISWMRRRNNLLECKRNDQNMEIPQYNDSSLKKWGHACCNPNGWSWTYSSSKTSQNSCSSESHITTVSVSLESRTFWIFSLPSKTSPTTLASCCNRPNNAYKHEMEKYKEILK